MLFSAAVIRRYNQRIEMYPLWLRCVSNLIAWKSVTATRRSAHCQIKQLQQIATRGQNSELPATSPRILVYVNTSELRSR